MDFFNEISLLYGTITEFCTSQTCPVMSASAQYEYLWCDNQKVKKPIKCSAPEYVDYLMSWVESQLNDEHVFPLQLGTSFPKNFQQTVKVGHTTHRHALDLDVLRHRARSGPAAGHRGHAGSGHEGPRLALKCTWRLI